MRQRDPDPDAMDYYSRIGVAPEADAETIERQRKRADRRFSPMGTSPDADEKRHMQINEASNVLEDPDERERYDDLYEALGPVDGTIVYEILPTDVIDDVREDETLRDHLRGFVEILGPEAGAREFDSYHGEVSTPLPEEIRSADLPNGYDVADVGFGIAAWSWLQTDDSPELSLWLTGGRQLWRTALVDPDAVDDQIDQLRSSGPATVPHDVGSEATREPDESGATDVASEAETAGESPATQISLGHPSSGVPTQQPPEETTSQEETEASRSLNVSAVATPARRFARVVSYVGSNSLSTAVSAAGAVAGGIAGSVAVIVAFVPLLAAALLVRSSAPGVDASIRSSVGVPIVGLDQPLATVSLLHYLTIVLLIGVSAWVTGRYVLPYIQERKRQNLPRDAWLVFGVILPAMAGALFVGVGRSALPRPLGLGVTALLTVFTFQAAMDVGAPRLLSLLCRSVATIAFALAGSVAALATVGATLSAVDPAVFEAYAATLDRLPLVVRPVFGIENATLVVVAFGALAFVPLALTTLYSLAYAVESAALRLRSLTYG